jgi:hypothetical protein
MPKNNLEQFEQEFAQEISVLKGARFAQAPKREFTYPAYNFFYKKAITFAFAMPALAFVFAFIFYPGKSVDGNLAMLEASNSRILAEINAMED